MENEKAGRGPPLLKLTKAGKVYGSAGVVALREVSLTIEPNEFVAITGVSGSGKSTLLHLLGCLDLPTSGSYQVADLYMSRSTSDERAELRKSTFGYIFQDFALLPYLTAEQNVLLPTASADTPNRDGRLLAQRLLKLLAMEHRSRHLPTELSGGQQQRVAIARAVVNRGSIILADEPTASLDTDMASEIMSLLASLHHAGRTVVVSTHDPAVIAFTHRVITLKDGVIVSDVKQDPVKSSVSDLTELDNVLRTSSNGRASPLAQAFDALVFSLRQLQANALRTALTVLGIIIGAAAFVAMVSVGQGQKHVIVERMANMGTDLLFIVPTQLTSPATNSGSTLLSVADARAIMQMPNVSAIAPEAIGNAVYRFANRDHQARTIATTAAYLEIKRRRIQYGTALTDLDAFQSRPVAVIGHETARALFGNSRTAIGQYMVANNVLLQVIGVLAPQGAATNGGDADDLVLVPLDTGQSRIIGQQGFGVINIRVDPPEAISSVQQRIEETLSKQRAASDFRVHNMSAIIDATNATRDSLTWLLAAIACLSLLVGGIGIMNVMLFSTMERAREIGIRVAYGASEKDIRWLFTIEALSLSVAGGAIGCLLGIGLSWALSAFGVFSQLAFGSCVLAIVFSVVVGWVFGYWPAQRAASRQPIDVLGR